MVSAESAIWSRMNLDTIDHLVADAGYRPNNSTRTTTRISFPDYKEYNAERETVSTQLWGDGASYGELRELWAKTGDSDYLDRMLEKVELDE